MRVFVTGASGWIGSAVVPELLGAGHTVVGLARSDASAGKLEAAGAEVLRGTLDDLDVLRRGAEAADGVVHLAFIHDFSDYQRSVGTDLRAVETLGAALEGSGRPFVNTAGLAGMSFGRPATERDTIVADSPRAASERTALAVAERGVRSSVVRLAPSVHGEGDSGFIAALAGIARTKGVSGYIGDGANRWPAVHRLDAARLFRLALEQAPAGSVLHGAGDEGIPIREIAEVIGRKLDLPVVSIPAEQAAEHFGWLGAFLAADIPASSALTQELLGWQPSGPGLLADLESGYYTR
ncbi:SDR family oxidoreductase [Petropleomorpha daqingensis]|uniref:Nucleoside-diphosphate-sugar epimerase n=1 Tax=Petropleomorpha daqingensis TaxID=2026353 RepID=A0A853CCY3_9ACTN|nr:SDR family oxidoreductase [Petropleomorpha daqingensis]NYJ05237.1 nucleoside-diphosphate-sugar epimerase [Petropleomorpha daqingensis]